MDAFYASVEQRDRPELKGKPVIVGGNPQSRGVVAACSYEARKFGIHSAMPSSVAYRSCPAAVFISPRFEVYKSVSADIREVFYAYTNLVEPLSLDEAFLDVTQNKKGLPSATRIAQEIRYKIHRKTGLTASAGVSFNKFLAKVASDFNKPNGITVITPGQADDFIDRLPIGKFFGVGKVTEEKMLRVGIRMGADLKKFDKRRLLSLFGRAGAYFYNIAHGMDDRPVQSNRIRKSIGKETTLIEDTDDLERMIEILNQLAGEVVRLLKRNDRKGLTITLKVKYSDFQCITRSATLTTPATDVTVIMTHVTRLLANTEAGARKVRLLGITISNFPDAKVDACKWVQLPLPFKNLAESV